MFNINDYYLFYQEQFKIEYTVLNFFNNIIIKLVITVHIVQILLLEFTDLVEVDSKLFYSKLK